MQLHIAHTRRAGIFRDTYELTAHLELTADELETVEQHDIGRLEIYHDPVRDALLARAEAADERARKLPWFTTTDELPAVIGKQWLESARVITFNIRALTALRVTVGDLMSGIALTHHDLGVISELETVITRSIDPLAARIAAARAFDDGHEDIITPGTDDDRVPPDQWPKR